MSNLYKQRYTVNNQNSTRIINSNEIVAEKLQELSRQAARKARAEGGFVAGLSPEVLEALPPEEPEVSLEEVREEASRLIEEAKEQSREILEKARLQAEDIHSQAKKEGQQLGYQEGQQKAEAELQAQQTRLQEKARQLEEKYRQNMEELEPKLVDVVADVFEKVFHVQFDDKKDILLYLVQNAILNIENSKEFQLRVCEENYQFLETHKVEILDRVGHNVNIEIVADSLMKENQCIIETDSGVFDCSLGVQLENLIKALRSLSL